MISILEKFDRQQLDALPVRKLYLPIIILGLLLAARVQYIQHGWLNPDSVLYFESARLFTLGDWQGAIKVYNWPLYSILIAATYNFTTLDIYASAQLLTVVFFGITTASFLKIIALGGGGSRVMLAGSLILFSSHYLVGRVLGMLMRDHGFWACYLTSLVFFIQFYKTKSYQDAFLWQISATLATLFRIEAISYLLFLPTILLVTQHDTWKQRVANFFKCNFLSIFAAVGICGALLLYNDLCMSNFGRLREVFTSNLYQELTQLLHEKATIMAEQVLGKYLQEFALQGILITFIYVIIATTISSTSIVTIGLSFFAIKSRRNLMDEKVFHVLKVTAVIAIINMTLIITKEFVLTGRYVLSLSLILMIFASFYLADLLKHLNSTSSNDRKLKWIAIALITVMSFSLVKNILPRATGYNYLKDAAHWITSNNKENKPVFYDNSIIRYYVGVPFIGGTGDGWKFTKTAIEDGTINQYDFLLISTSSKSPEKESLIATQLPQFHMVARFSSGNNKKAIVIYRK
jgi:hypothetical protein